LQLIAIITAMIISNTRPDHKNGQAANHTNQTSRIPSIQQTQTVCLHVIIMIIAIMIRHSRRIERIVVSGESAEQRLHRS